LVTITPGSHTIIPINTPQGTLEIKLKSKINYSFLVKKSGENKTLNVQEINTLQKYLTGYYDIELLTIPRINFDSVRINQSSKTTYSIPPPGLANIILPSNGYGGVYLKKDDKLEEIYSFKAEKNQYRLTLLPGNYVVVFRSKSSKKYLYTSEKEFKIKSGKSQLIKIY
jgi:Ca-activated chloride channel family protein